MKTASILALFLVAVLAQAANVTFNLTDFLGTVETLKRRQATLEPRSTVRGNSTNLVMSERRYFNTGTNGIFTATNLNEGLYRVTVAGISYTSVFHINIPSTNGNLQASDYLTTLAGNALESEEGETIDLE